MIKKLIFLILLIFTGNLSAQQVAQEWSSEKHSGYIIFFRQADKQYIKEYTALLEKCISNTEAFCGDHFKNKFDVFVHPDRSSIDIQWSKDFNIPGFKSESWMVASGSAARLDIISPVRWDKLSSEHSYSDKLKTEQLLTHELLHVFHGQNNISPDFTNTINIDWFVEGFAVYGSGQLNEERMKRVSSAVDKNSIPESLDQFWTGENKYGLSGSVVKYIDIRFGRKALLSLLKYNDKKDILNTLGISEIELLKEWRSFIGKS